MPVIDIPLDDSKFQRFNKLFGQYEERLAKTPGVWQKVDKAFRQTTAAMLAQNQVMREFGGGDKAQERAGRIWQGIAAHSRSTLGNVLHISRELMKWGTMIGGGLLGGSLFGIDRMAGSLASSRFGYQGLGMNYGSFRSFGINMGRFTDPGSFLSSINQAVSNPALQGPLYSMGVNPNGSTEQVSLKMLEAMRRLAINTPRGLLGTASDSYGLQPYGGLETLLRLRTMSASEFYKQLQHEQQDRNTLGLPPSVARKWTDFTNQMERAKSSIFKTFVVGLVPLEKPLERLSVAFSGFLSKVMTGPEMKKGIDNLATMLNQFSTPRFLKAMTDFTTDIEKAASVFNRWFGNPTNPGARDPHDNLSNWWRQQKEFWKTGVDSSHFRYGHPTSGDMGKLKGFLASLDKANGLPAGTMARIAQTESSFNANAVSSKGAMGMFQLMPGTAKMLGVTDPFDAVEEGRAAASYMGKLLKHYHGNIALALAANNWGQGNVDAALARAVKRGRGVGLPRSVQTYVQAVSPNSGIIVTARHATGANPVYSVAGLAGVPR